MDVILAGRVCASPHYHNYQKILIASTASAYRAALSAMFSLVPAFVYRRRLLVQPPWFIPMLEFYLWAS